MNIIMNTDINVITLEINKKLKMPVYMKINNIY